MIAYHFLYEVYMMPIVYIGILNSLYSVSEIMDAHLLIGWVVLGPFYVIYALVFDMIQLVKVLQLYKIDNDKDQKEAEE